MAKSKRMIKKKTKTMKKRTRIIKTKTMKKRTKLMETMTKSTKAMKKNDDTFLRMLELPAFALPHCNFDMQSVQFGQSPFLEPLQSDPFEVLCSVGHSLEIFRG